MRLPGRILTPAAALAAALAGWPDPAAAQPRDGFNSTPRTFAGQVTRGSDLVSPLTDGYRRPMPFRDTRYTYPSAPTDPAGPTDSVLDTITRDIGLAPTAPAIRRGFGSSAPPSGPPGLPGPPMTVVDPIAERGFVSMMELIGLPVVTSGGEALGTVLTVGHAADGSAVAIVGAATTGQRALAIDGLRLDRAAGTVATGW